MNNKEIMSRIAGGIYPYVRVLDVPSMLKHATHTKTDMMGRLVDAEVSEDDANVLIFTIEYSDCNVYNKEFNNGVVHTKDIVYVTKKGHNFEIVNLSHVPNFAQLKQIQQRLQITLKELGHSDSQHFSRLLASSIANLV